MLVPFILLGQNLTFSDGPYIFIKKDRLVEKSLINGKVITKDLEINRYDTIYYPAKSSFSNVNKIAALSDIHGQFDLLVALLKNNKIIDNNLDWSFNKGHLVIVGDVFDREIKLTRYFGCYISLKFKQKIWVVVYIFFLVIMNIWFFKKI